MTKAENEHLVFCTDFQRCVGEASLKEILVGLDRLGYKLVAVSQDGDAYTVFFRRPRGG